MYGPPGMLFAHRAAHDDGHIGFMEAAVRAEPVAPQPAEVVFGLTAPDDGAVVAEHRDATLRFEGKVELPRRRLPREHPLEPGNLPCGLDDLLRTGPSRLYPRTNPPSAPWWPTQASEMGQITMLRPRPSSASRRSCSHPTRGEPSSFTLSFMPWSDAGVPVTMDMSLGQVKLGRVPWATE